LCKSRIVAVFDNTQKLEVCDGQQDESIQSGKQTLELDSSGASEKKSTLAALDSSTTCHSNSEANIFQLPSKQQEGTILHAFLHIKTDRRLFD
jgi:hypothetical protein